MYKDVSVERLFSLGDFKNIKFISTVSGVPSEVLLNKDAMSHLWYLQLLEIEESYHKYNLLTRKIVNTSNDDIVKMIEEERSQTYNDLMEAMAKEK